MSLEQKLTFGSRKKSVRQMTCAELAERHRQRTKAAKKTGVPYWKAER